MIPILYNGDETRFVTNGIGRLSSCTRAVVTEERNGIYELEFDMPITGEHFEDITLGKIVACTHDDKHDIQPFVIYQKSIPDLNGIVTFNAHHISYRLCDVVVMPFTAGSVVEALNKIGSESVNINPFSFWTDKTTVADFNNDVPRLARNILGGEENSILDIYGSGEYEFDMFDVKLYAHRGQSTSVEIRYGKNLSELNQTVSQEFSYNAVVPYWADSEGTIVTLPERMLVFEGVEPQVAYLTDENLIIIRNEDNEPIEVAYSVVDAVPMDLSDQFEEAPTVEQLRNAATSRFENSGAWLPDENIEVNFVQLWQTEEYKDYAALQRVSLCDTVSVYYPQGGINAVQQKVVKVEYNVLADRYDSIELGSVQTSLGQAIQTQILENVPTKSMMDSAIQYASDMIRGGLGGYVVMTPGANGYPQEILIMDTPDVNTAVNVWRFNQGGLGHSHNGYQGSFDDIALTQDGRINASMITTGELTANLIRAGTLTDADGNNYWNLESGDFVTEQGKVGPFEITSYHLEYLNPNNARAEISTTGMELRQHTYWSDNTESITGLDLYYGNIYFIDDPDLTNLYTSRRVMDLYLSYNDSSRTKYALVIEDELSNDYIAKFRNWRASSTAFQIWFNGGVGIENGGLQADFADVFGDLYVEGTKSRKVTTENYDQRLLYCYETPTPLFGDIGEAVIDEDGYCYVDLDDIFTETIDKQEYQVFLQKEGNGDCWVEEKTPRYFVIEGTPNLKVAWELKAKQKDYGLTRLEQFDNGLDEYEYIQESNSLINEYINEQEELLYGNY